MDEVGGESPPGPVSSPGIPGAGPGAGSDLQSSVATGHTAGPGSKVKAADGSLNLGMEDLSSVDRTGGSRDGLVPDVDMSAVSVASSSSASDGELPLASNDIDFPAPGSPVAGLSQAASCQSHSPASNRPLLTNTCLVAPVKRVSDADSDGGPAAKKVDWSSSPSARAVGLEDVSSDESDTGEIDSGKEASLRNTSLIDTGEIDSGKEASLRNTSLIYSTSATPVSAAKPSALGGKGVSSPHTHSGHEQAKSSPTAPAAHGTCPVEATVPGKEEGKTRTVVETGHFIRQRVVHGEAYREFDNDTHAEIGPVSFKQDRIVMNHSKSEELPLPENWIEIYHVSGAPLYMERASRVCTWARPYCLGPNSARKHEIPAFAVPCLMQGVQAGTVEKKMLIYPETEQQLDSGKKQLDNGKEAKCSASASGVGAQDPESALHTVPIIRNDYLPKYLAQRWKIENMDSVCLCRHCRKKMGETAENNSDDDAAESKLAAQKADALSMGELQSDGSLFFRIGRKGGAYLNTAGKTPLSVLNEYCQRILRVRPEFTSEETMDSKSPFRVIVTLNKIQYGIGAGQNKKVAKQLAAELTLQAINPLVGKQLELAKNRQASDIDEAFGEMPVDDPGIPQLCVELGMPGPSQILAECLRRNQSLQRMTCDLKMELQSSRSARYEMTCGEHKVDGKCINKKVARQIASQAMLKLLHPHIITWASLMSLYCDKTRSAIQHQPFDDQDDAEMAEALQNQVGKKTEVNQDVLTELRRRMKKLIPATDSGRPLAPKKVRQLHDFKPPSTQAAPVSLSVPATASLPPPSHSARSPSASDAGSDFHSARPVSPAAPGPRSPTPGSRSPPYRHRGHGYPGGGGGESRSRRDQAYQEAGPPSHQSHRQFQPQPNNARAGRSGPRDYNQRRHSSDPPRQHYT